MKHNVIRSAVSRLVAIAPALVSILLVLSILLSGCTGKTGLPVSSAITPAPPRGITGTISTGKTVVAVTVPVLPSGGKVTVTDASSPIAGLEISVPANSYAESKQFKLSYAPVEKHSFGEAFNPVTPMITVDNGGGYAQELIEVRVPVEVPEGNFAMGFLYDDKTKKLEGLPTLARDANSITVGTQHFSNVIISMIPETNLKPDIDSGFRPGIDDWQFTNWGSYIAPGGQCAGQSLTAMWYYINQPDGKDMTLYGRYDNNGNKPATPGFWQDDSLAYRFASVVQTDVSGDWGASLFRSQRGVNDELAWKSFAYSIQLTGEPQFASILSSEGGHAIIVYRIFQGDLYVADPNRPGNTERRIEYKNGKFTPYDSALKSGGNGIIFDKIGYAAKTAMVDWSTIAQHWTELKNKTIGDDKFPQYELVYVDSENNPHPLKDSLVSPTKSLYIVSRFPADEYITVDYWRNGVLLPTKGERIELEPGKNVIGVLVSKAVQGKQEYVDFKYINVTFGALTIEPEALDGEVNKDYTFTAKTESPPDNARYDWFIDGDNVKSGPANTLTTKFKSADSYSIEAKLFDKDGKEIASGEAQASIKEPLAPVTATPTPTRSGHPIVTSFSYPTTFPLNAEQMLIDQTALNSSSYAFSVKVSGGKPPYTYTWTGNNQVIYEGTQYATVNLNVSQMRFNGGSYSVSFTVHDSADTYAKWIGGSGIANADFTWAITFVGGKRDQQTGKVIKPASFRVDTFPAQLPYKSP